MEKTPEASSPRNCKSDESNLGTTSTGNNDTANAHVLPEIECPTVVQHIPEGVSGILSVAELMVQCKRMKRKEAELILHSEKTEPEEWYLKELLKQLRSIGYEFAFINGYDSLIH